MPTKIISGTLTIPITEPASGGFYTDLELRLFFVTGLTEILDQTHTVPTTMATK